MEHLVVHPGELLDREKVAGRQCGFAATIQWVLTARNTGVRVAVVFGELLDPIRIDFEDLDIGLDMFPLQVDVFLELA